MSQAWTFAKQDWPTFPYVLVAGRTIIESRGVDRKKRCHATTTGAKTAIAATGYKPHLMIVDAGSDRGSGRSRFRSPKPTLAEYGGSDHFLMISRTLSIMPPAAFWILPSTLSALPSDSSL